MSHIVNTLTQQMESVDNDLIIDFSSISASKTTVLALLFCY